VVLGADVYQGFGFATSFDEAGVQLLLHEEVQVVHGVVLSEQKQKARTI
jgi:hypothetical protein